MSTLAQPRNIFALIFTLRIDWINTEYRLGGETVVCHSIYNIGCMHDSADRLMNKNVRSIRSSGWHESLAAVPVGYVASLTLCWSRRPKSRVSPPS